MGWWWVLLQPLLTQKLLLTKRIVTHTLGLPFSPAGKESACNAGDPGSIPGSGRFPEEGIDYPRQDPWAFLVAQLVKNSPAVQETWVRFLGWEDPLKKG